MQLTNEYEFCTAEQGCIKNENAATSSCHVQMYRVLEKQYYILLKDDNDLKTVPNFGPYNSIGLRDKNLHLLLQEPK